MSDRDVLGRVMRPIDAVAEVGPLCQRLMAMQYAGRDE